MLSLVFMADVFPGQPYMDDSASAICEPQDEEANAMAEESPSGIWITLNHFSFASKTNISFQ